MHELHVLRERAKETLVHAELDECKKLQGYIQALADVIDVDIEIKEEPQ